MAGKKVRSPAFIIGANANERTVLSTVLLVGPEGRVAHSAGKCLNVENVLRDARFKPIRQRLRAAFRGRSFRARLRFPESDLPLTVEGTPVRDPEGEVRAISLSLYESELPVNAPAHPAEIEFVIQHMRQGIWRLNSLGVITYANPYLARWLETDESVMIGQHFSRYRNLTQVSPSEGQEGLSQRYDAEFLTRTGVVRRAIVVTSPTVDQDGRVTGTIDLITDITAEHAVQAKLVEEVEKMAELATRDPLTGCANRLGFDEAFAEIHDDELLNPFGLLIMDLDKFKEYNDTYGHAFGDKVLVEFAAHLKDKLRAGDVVARVGGDEFTVLLPRTSHEGTIEVAERLRKDLHFPMSVDGRTLTVTCSVGAAHSDDGAEFMLESADREMYRLKFARRTDVA